jgi:hypothetical protein
LDLVKVNNIAGWSILQHNQDVQSLFRMPGSIRQTQDPPLILTIPNSHDKFHSECDASEYALGTVYHNTKTRNENLLVLLSKHSHPLNGIMKFTTRELLAIMVPLLGETYHSKNPQKPNHQEGCWLTELQEFHFKLYEIQYKADILPRRPGFEKGVDNNNNIIFSPKKPFFQQMTQITLTNSTTIHSFYEQHFHHIPSTHLTRS